MNVVSPLYTAAVASVLFFIVFLMLKFTLDKEIIDWLGALKGAIVFGIIIFIIHQFLNRKYSN